MAAEILLEINGHKYNASGFSYDFYQGTDFKGKPVTGIRGGDIHVVLESSYDNSILETMLSNKTRKVPCVSWEEYEPCPIYGKIQLVQDGVHVFRELAFEEAYITRYKEKMDANGYPMSILLTISTLRLDINKFVRMDRRPETTYGFGWVRFKEKEIEKSPMSKSYAEPMVLVTSVKGKETALPNEKVKYEVTGYNISNVKDKDRKRVKWDIVVDGKQEKQKEKGEILHLQIKDEWIGKEVIVMPYLKKSTISVCAKTIVKEWYVPRVIIQTKTKEGFGDKNERNTYEYEDIYGNGLTGKATQIAPDMHWGNGEQHTDSFTLSQITDKNVLKNIHRLNQKSDKDLFTLFKELIKWTSRGELEKQNLALVSHLERHINTEYNNKILTESAFSTQITIDFISNIRQGIILAIKNKSGDLNMVNFRPYIKNITRPNFSIKKDRLKGLTIAIHDIWGFRVIMEEYSFDPDKRECVAKVRYRIFDHFGLDYDDIIGYGSKEKIMSKMGILGSIVEELTIPRPSQGIPQRSGMMQPIAEEVADGFCSWFILQHFRGYEPFVTAMEKVEIIKFKI